MAKVYSAPVPNRAASDPRLGTLHFRVLIEVAAHDRMTSNRYGYLLPVRRMAERLNADYSNVAAAVRSLIAWDYLIELPHPKRKHKQARMLAIVYSDDDGEFIERGPTNRGARKPRSRPSNSGAQQPRSKNETVVAAGKTVVERPEFHEQNQSFPRREDIDLKVLEDTPLKEAHSAAQNACDGDGQIGNFVDMELLLPSEWTLARHLPARFLALTADARLAAWERAFAAVGRDPAKLAHDELVYFSEHLLAIMDASEGEDGPTSGWAERLYLELEP